MILAVRACRPAPTFLSLITVTLATVASAFLLAGCAGSDAPPPPPPPRQIAGAPRYVCPDGRSFTMQSDPATRQTDLFLTGAGGHRLDPVADPDGGTLFQDADFQLRPAGGDAYAALTDRSTTVRQTCSRTP